MNDLIRRSDVINVLDECHLDKQLFEKDVYDKVSAIPTAYDIEKVVAELEHEAKLQKLFEEEFYARHNIAQAHVHRYAEQCYRNKAIEIVRKGGAE